MKMRQRELVRGLILATWVLIAPAAASASDLPKFVIRDLGRIDGFAGVSATDINASGVVTGQAFNLGGASVGMVSFNGLQATAISGFTPTAINDAGIMAGLDPVAGTAVRRAQNGSLLVLGSGVARGINNQGTIVGDLATISYSQAFQWTEAGGLQVFGPAGNTSISPVVPSDINDVGQIAGSSNFPQRALRGTAAGGLVELAMPIGGTAQAFAINAAGWAAGRVSTIGQTSAAIWQPDGTLINAGDLAGGQANAIFRDISDTGIAVGRGSDATGLRATFWTAAGGLLDLNTLIDSSSGWFLSDAAAINASGQIAATGFRNGVQHLLRLDPVLSVTPPPTGVIPEPATWAMLIAGFGVVGASLRRRRAITAS